MADIILKVAFPYRDERLFPPGWRSFSQEYWSVQSIELVKEIILINAIEEPCTVEIVLVNDLAQTTIEITAIFQLEITNEIILLENIDGEQTTEIILVNDLAQTTVEITAIFQLEITNEIISYNFFNDEITKEIIAVNYLSAEKIKEIICLNDLEATEIATKEIICLNRLEESVSLERYSHTIRVFLDDSLINDYIKDWSIGISESSYVHSITVNFVNSVLFSQCDPSVNIKTKRIKLVIDTIEFQFLLEKRDVKRSPTIGEFGIWGRSLIAILDLPYAVPIIDKDIVQDPDTDEWYCPDDANYVPHIWQTGDRLASEIMNTVIKPPFTTVDFSLDFRLNDYLVRKGALSVNNSSPIKIVDQLASSIGGRVRTTLTDRVVVKYYKFNITGTQVATYTDLENIFQLDEKLSFPQGYNRILVKGWEDPLTESSIGLKIELDSVLNDEKTTFYFGEEIWIRVYRSPFALTYSKKCSLGTLYSETTSEITTITEEKAVFMGASLQLSYPINSITMIQRYNCETLIPSQYSYTQGYDFITSEDSQIQDEPVVITYTTKSDLYKLVVDQPCDPLPWREILSQITIRQT